MHEKSTILALIPARGGSKGLPNKNILDCAGKPLIEWTITAALEADLIDDVLITTDSVEIAEVARNAGASVPFLRPESLGDDNSSMLDVISHAWNTHFDPKGNHYDYIVLLQPTSPLRNSSHVNNAIKLYFKNSCNRDATLASVYPVSQKFGWLMHKSDDDMNIHFCLDVSTNNPQRQKLKQYFLPNGAIFMVSGYSLSNGLYRDNTIPFIMDANDSIDIDTLEDFKSAELTLKQRIS